MFFFKLRVVFLLSIRLNVTSDLTSNPVLIPNAPAFDIKCNYVRSQVNFDSPDGFSKALFFKKVEDIFPPTWDPPSSSHPTPVGGVDNMLRG